MSVGSTGTADLDVASVPEIAETLRRLLADVFALYLKTKNFHWHISGRHFRDDHLLLDEYATQIFSMVDDIAERIRKVGGTALRSIGDIVRYTLLMQPQQDAINRWSDAAPFWEKHREIIRHMFAPVTNALVEDALIGSGDSVLDIATGPGEPALSIACLVGPEGKVFGIDPVLEMVDAARREGDRLRVRNAQFEVGPADHLPFPADTFDVVVSRFGVMFFASPVDAVREMLRVLKPGGRLALAVWHLAEQNPFFYTLSRVIDRYVNSPPPAPDALDAFRFARPGLLRDVVGEAGTLVPSERMLQFTIEVPVSVEDFWTLRFEMSETLREKVSKLSMEQLTEVKRQALEAFREYSRDHGMSFPAEVLIVSGSKSWPA